MRVEGVMVRHPLQYPLSAETFAVSLSGALVTALHKTPITLLDFNITIPP
jgi:hypothetical protein